MLSSTFSSEEKTRHRSYLRPIAGTLALVVLLLAGLEGGTRLVFRRLSHIESRTHSDYVAALATRAGGAAHPTDLLLGNSLLLEGIDYAGLRRAMEPNATPVRFVVESTTYLDWYYGIRRLLSGGAHPDRIVLCLSLSQLMTSKLRGEYSAFYLIQTADLVSAGRDGGLDLTGTSGLFFGRFSMFYAARNNFRNFALSMVDAPYERTLHGLTTTTPAQISDAQVLKRATPRLNTLRAICSQYGVDFAFLLPPGFGSGAEGLMEAGRRTSTTVLAPVPLNSWPADLYADGFHLNSKGAAEFTRLLAGVLLQQSHAVSER